MYTLFFDMSSGGSEKEAWTVITVNLPKDDAVEWFETKFGHSAYEVTCDCCGQDYSINSYGSLEDALSGYERYTHKHFEV